MQAILELLIAAVSGIAEAIAGLFFSASLLVLTAIEFLFVAVTMGLGPARERVRTSSERWRDSRKRTAPASTDESPESSPLRAPPWFPICILMGTIVVGISLYVSARIRAQRIETAKKLVDQSADDIASLIALGNAPPARGLLPSRDPWGEPVELFLDDFAVGMLVVVRSAGPDQKTGTLDDLLCIRMQQKGAKQMAEDLGAQAKAKVMKLLKREHQDDR